MEKVVVPFTDDQIESLNAFQAFGTFHPFTCGESQCREILRATAGGWHCPKCTYRQNWAHSFMANWSWRRRRAPGAPQFVVIEETE
jgi:hypothetical protein